MSRRNWTILLISFGCAYSWLGVKATGFSATFPLPDFVQDLPILVSPIMHAYSLIAMASLAVLPAYVIVKASIPRGVLFSVLAGLPVIPITAWGIYSWVNAEPEVTEIVLSSSVIGGTIVAVTEFIIMLPLLVWFAKRQWPSNKHGLLGRAYRAPQP